MRPYDDPVEVRRGQVSGVDAPEQFLWRGRLWKVRAVLAHWVETGPWWHSPDDRPRPVHDPAPERELWRVEAGRGRVRSGSDGSSTAGGVFDLSFDGAEGRWQLVGCEE